VRDNRALAGVVAILYFLIWFVGGTLFLMWLLKNLVTIGIGLMTIVVPIFLIIVGAVLVKKYLLEG